MLNVCDCVAELFDYGMTAKGVNIEVVGLGWEDQESHNGGVWFFVLQERIQPGEGLDEDISAFVSKLISSSGKEVQGLVQVEVHVAGMDKVLVFWLVVMRVIVDQLEI